MYRLYVERREGFENEAKRYLSEINGFLGISSVTGVRYFNRYDIENVSEEVAKIAATRIFSEPQSDYVTFEELPNDAKDAEIIWEFLPGQYDQRSDSAEQCISLLRAGLKNVQTSSEEPVVRCAKIVRLSGKVSKKEIEKIQEYLINPVDSRLTDAKKPDTLKMKVEILLIFLLLRDLLNLMINNLKNIATKWVLLCSLLILSSFKIFLKAKVAIL